MTEGNTIKVPQVEGPTKQLCYVSPPLDGTQGNPMLHCDRPKGHAGSHYWEVWNAKQAAEARLTTLTAEFQKHKDISFEHFKRQGEQIDTLTAELLTNRDCVSALNENVGKLEAENSRLRMELQDRAK